MTNGRLAGMLLLGLALIACKRASSDAPASGSSGPKPGAASTPGATAEASATAKTEPAKVGKPIPEIDPKLPVEKLDLAAFSKLSKDEKAKLVGKKLHLEGELHGVSYNAMIFGDDQNLWGPEKEGTQNGVYQVELHGKKAPNETWSKETAICFVDEKTQKELLTDFKGGKTVQLEVEGIVNRTFDDLAPCKVISKKVAK